MKRNQEGFTLIELLVVVAIIGILSGIAFVSIRGARESAYDTQIKSELAQVRSGAEMHYYDQGGTYGGGGVVGVTAFDESSSWDRIKDALPPCSVARHNLASVDLDGDPQHYQINVGNQSYRAWAALCTDANESGDVHYYCIDSDGNAIQTTNNPHSQTDNDFGCPSS